MLVGWRKIIHTARQAGRNRVRKGHGTLFFGPTDGGGGHLLLLIIRSPLAHGAPPHQPRTPPSRSFVPIRSFASKAPSHPRPRASLLSLSLAASRPPASSRHRPCCSDLCRRMSRRSPFVDWTFVLRDYAPSLLIQCNSPLIFVVDIFFFASILCSIHCAVPKFLRSDIKLRYC